MRHATSLRGIVVTRSSAATIDVHVTQFKYRIYAVTCRCNARAVQVPQSTQLCTAVMYRSYAPLLTRRGFVRKRLHTSTLPSASPARSTGYRQGDTYHTDRFVLANFGTEKRDFDCGTG